MKKFTSLIGSVSLMSIIFLLMPQDLWAQGSTTFSFTSSGAEQSFTVPQGVTSITIQAWGGGGGGGGVASTPSGRRGGGGGAGGSYVQGTIPVVPGEQYSVIVGWGGLGYSALNGGDGGSSIFLKGTTTYFVALGGPGGVVGNTANPWGNGGIAPDTGNTFTGTSPASNYGGNGAVANYQNTYDGGGGGGSAGASSGGGDAQGRDGGAAGVGGGAQGGQGRWDGDGPGNSGGFPGAGGGGAKLTINGGDNYAGGNGSNGEVIVSWPAPSRTSTMANNDVSADSVCAGTTKVPIQSFTIAQYLGNATLTGLNFTTTGTYTGTDISNFKLWTNTSNNLSSATQVGSAITTGLGVGSHSFGTISQLLTSGNTRYFWITMDVASSATSGRTLGVNDLSTTNFTVSTGNKAGSSSIGGTQTIIAKPTIATVATPADICAGSSLTTTLLPAPTVTANGSTVTAQGFELETSVGGGTYAALSLPYPVSFADNGKNIRYYATNDCGTTYSNVVVLTVRTLPTVSITGNNSPICSGGNAVFDLSGTSDATVTYNINGGNNQTVTLMGGTA